MKRIYVRRTLLIALVAVSSCAVIFPPEHGPSAEILRSRYVTDEQRAAAAALNSPEMSTAIEAARRTP